MSNHEWPTFKAGDRVWSVLRNCWVELRHVGGDFYDGEWYYTEVGSLVGAETIPLLFHDEIKPEDWPQPKAPLPDLNDGDPTWVRDYDGQPWNPRRFARFSSDDNRVFCYTVGDKWSSKGRADSWNHWRLPTKEELEFLSEQYDRQGDKARSGDNVGR